MTAIIVFLLFLWLFVDTLASLVRTLRDPSPENIRRLDQGFLRKPVFPSKQNNLPTRKQAVRRGIVHLVGVGACAAVLLYSLLR